VAAFLQYISTAGMLRDLCCSDPTGEAEMGDALLFILLIAGVAATITWLKMGHYGLY
jgi:hypothetical protein